MSSWDELRPDSDTPGRLQPALSDGQQSWHFDTLSSPHLPPDPFTISDDYGPDGAVGASCRYRQSRRTFQGLRAGWSSWRTELEYNAARGRHGHATFRERADASVLR
jgi:hypothetical protein